MKKLILLVSLSIGLLYSCKDTNNEALDLEKERQASIDSMKMEIEKQRIIDSMQLVNSQRAESKKEVVVVNQTAPAPAKKKWSGAAKGAVIGAGVGAVTGAAISKNKAEGAIIGGLAGAGVGAGTGAIVDESKKKE
ncbi:MULTISPECIES: glycine zipper family protein [Flavobacterium]|uniref:Glycine zipper family protein n=1 Tax=Flavobacterium hankyongi TaxID=1176532 RepID=A0ABP8ZKM9_9FLAO|nr:glycine zipper family protein [Flavobacterium sp. N1846]